MFAKLIPPLAVGLALGLGLAWFLRPSAPAPDVAAAHTSPDARTSASPAPSLSAQPEALPAAEADPATSSSLADETQAASAASEEPPVSSLSDEARALLIDEITEAYTTYEPSALPRIEPYLRHADPEIRAYAREAVVQVGHADGVRLLRNAAKAAADPREAVALLDAAEYLELPPASPAASGSFKRPLRGTKPTASL